MKVFSVLSGEPRRPRRATARPAAFTLVEVMISLGVLALGTMGGISAFLLLNRYAANLRNMSEARALCQERIEQAQTLQFRPGSGVIPAAPNADPTQTAANADGTRGCLILGAASNYNSSGAFIGGSGLQTSSENIPVYTQPDGTSALVSPVVTYTRSTTVSPTTLVNAAGASLNVVLFTVTVSYFAHDQTYTTSMSTLRGPD